MQAIMLRRNPHSRIHNNITYIQIQTWEKDIG
jgi:hypothetical protein